MPLGTSKDWHACNDDILQLLYIYMVRHIFNRITTHEEQERNTYGK